MLTKDLPRYCCYLVARLMRTEVSVFRWRCGLSTYLFAAHRMTFWRSIVKVATAADAQTSIHITLQRNNTWHHACILTHNYYYYYYYILFRLRHFSTSRKVTGSIPDDVTGIFHWHNPSGRTMALGSTQPLTEMSTRNISWGVKAAGA
jgi:hypothetical protein